MSNYKNGKYISTYNDRKLQQNYRRITREKKELDIVCKEFGCGKKLTATEYLYSEYCFKHARNHKNNSI